MMGKLGGWDRVANNVGATTGQHVVEYSDIRYSGRRQEAQAWDFKVLFAAIDFAHRQSRHI
jgi:hypothetical protein